MNLRTLARNQDCQVRIPGVCNGDPACACGGVLRTIYALVKLGVMK